MTGWPHYKKIGKHFYTHLSNYFTTVKRKAEEHARMMGRRDLGTLTKVVKREIKGGDGKFRTVYSVYYRQVTPGGKIAPRRRM